MWAVIEQPDHTTACVEVLNSTAIGDADNGFGVPDERGYVTVHGTDGITREWGPDEWVRLTLCRTRAELDALPREEVQAQL